MRRKLTYIFSHLVSLYIYILQLKPDKYESNLENNFTLGRIQRREIGIFLLRISNKSYKKKVIGGLFYIGSDLHTSTINMYS